MSKVERLGVTLIGCIEIVIGLIAIVSLIETKLLWGISKPPAVFLFVLITSTGSLCLGVGILQYKMWARKLLMFFAGYIALTKILIYTSVITLSPPFETLIPPDVKNGVSLAYHLLVILLLNTERIRLHFK